MAKEKQQSLAAQSGAVATAELKMPAVFSAPTQKVEGKFWAPYVTFAHPKRGDEYKKLQAKFGSVQEGAMYLIADGDVFELPVLKCALITHFQCWVHKKENGELIAVSLEEQPKPFQEVIETILLVYLPDRALFATAKFSRTKSGAGGPLYKELQACQTPEWLAKSDAHAMAAKMGFPWLRYYANVQLGDRRVGKGSGMPYNPLLVTPFPTTSTEWALAKKLQDDPKCQKYMDAVSENFERRVGELKSKLPQKAA